MRTLRSSLIGGLVAALLLAAPATAAPPPASGQARQAPEIDVTPARLTVYPLGTARVQIVLTNPTNAEQIFALEILLVQVGRSDLTV